ncbi:MAG TPA: universal stress protein [Pseudohongiella sp.]|nr:universal stress protein [Pseudohongiella sp.]
MADYRKVLVAIDGSEESDRIIAKAVEMAESNKAELSAVMVFEPPLGSYTIELEMADFTEVLRQAQEELANDLRARMAVRGVPAERVHFLSGKPATEIKALVKSSGTDLLVIGSHGHNPVRAMLGSTANAVLHGIGCDVLTVRV